MDTAATTFDIVTYVIDGEEHTIIWSEIVWNDELIPVEIVDSDESAISTMKSAFAQFERDKFIERTNRRREEAI